MRQNTYKEDVVAMKMLTFGVEGTLNKFIVTDLNVVPFHFSTIFYFMCMQ